MSTPGSPRSLAASLLLLFALLASGCTVAAQASPPSTPTPAAVAQAPVARATIQRVTSVPAAQAQPATPTAAAPLAPTAIPTAVPTAIPTADPNASPTPWPTPTARPAGTPPRVGLQVGHLRSNELPEELARLRTSTGARYGSVTEADLNLDIVNRIKPLLEAEGVIVDVLPATVPPGYDADAFLAIHADGSRSPAARGWKLATPWRASEASKNLMAAVGAAYGPATGLPEDVGGVTVNMRGYYAFNWRRHDHSIARTTPAIIVEMGFMSNAADRNVMFGQPDRVARGIADGILAYLRSRDPNNGAALVPPDFPVHRTGPDGAIVRAAPRDDARILARAPADTRITPFDRSNGYFQAFVRVGESRVIGWVREDQLIATNEQPTFPTPTNP
jgi:N-acetylmuramoyl-L-alanine amidase